MPPVEIQIRACFVISLNFCVFFREEYPKSDFLDLVFSLSNYKIHVKLLSSIFKIS